MRVRGYSKTAVVMALCLAVTSLGGSSAHADAADPAASLSAPTGQSEHGNFVVHEDSYGSTFTWRPREELPMGGARPEFFLDGQFVGAPLAKGGVLTLRVPGLQGAKARSVSAVSGGRVLDGRALPSAKKRTTTKAPVQPAAILKDDPGKKGRYKTESFTYTAKSLKVAGYPSRLEMKALVVAPKGAKGKRPVVLFLHGRHGTCYVGEEVDLAWPCADGMKSIPSYRGYAEQQRLLASQGYVTVSVSANGINAQDAEVADAGSGARALVVREHLALLAKWNAGVKATGKDARVIKRVLSGHMNLKKVMTVGHSRGGEGVNRAALQEKKGDPFRIVAQVLVAPTDFGRQVAVGVPTTVLLPFCDGDVSDLQGQQYVDQGARIAAGDNSLKTSVLVMGANHNYFNTYWTPNATAAPASDDWWDAGDAACGSKARSRLKPAAQRAVGSTYIAAAARTFLTRSTSAVKLLDGTAVRAASAGRAVVLTSAVGGKRRAVVVPSSALKVKASVNASATVCDGFALDEGVGTPCTLDGSWASPHWLPSSYQTTGSPSPRALRFAWKKTGGAVTISAPRDLGSYRHIDLRVIADPSVTAGRFALVLRDASGRKVKIKSQNDAAHLPAAGETARLWAQTVRFTLPKRSRVNMSKIASISLVGTSARGKVYVLDGHLSSSGLRATKVTSKNVARFNVQDAVVTRDARQSEQTGYLTVPISNAFTSAARVWVEVSDLNAFAGYSGKYYTVQPGQREIKVPVVFAGDDIFTDDSFADQGGYGVRIEAKRNAVVDRVEGRLTVRNSAPRPTLSVEQTDVVAKPGGVVRWVLTLSAPMTQDYYGFATAVPPTLPGGELTLASAVPSWFAQFGQGAAKAMTFSQAGVVVGVSVPAYSTTTTIEVPVRDLAYVGDGRTLEFVVEPDGAFVPEPITLRARIEPKEG